MPKRVTGDSAAAPVLELVGVLLVRADLPPPMRTWFQEIDGRDVLFLRDDVWNPLADLVAVHRANLPHRRSAS